MKHIPGFRLVEYMIMKMLKLRSLYPFSDIRRILDCLFFSKKSCLNELGPVPDRVAVSLRAGRSTWVSEFQTLPRVTYKGL